MKWSYRLAVVSGIEVRVHVTFLLLLAWFAAAFWSEGGVAAAVSGVGFILLLFLCVLLHEFGHALAARVYGIRTPDITLLPIGGVARLERMPEKPSQELVVAVAGPAVNVAIAAGLFAVLAAKVSLADFTELDRPEGSLLAKLLAVNVMLVLFNALPAFPMDGGRVLRALLAMRMDYARATAIAARTGQVLAVGFAVWSFFGSPMLLFIAVFVFLGAQQELACARFRAPAASGAARSLSSEMIPHFQALPARCTVREALALARVSRVPVFPVVGDGLRALGLVDEGVLERAMADGFSEGPVAAVAVPSVHAPATTPPALLAHLPRGTIVIVENPSGQIVGLWPAPAHGGAVNNS